MVAGPGSGSVVMAGGHPGVAYGGAVPVARKGTITDALFTQLDVNNDGVISRSEFRRGLKGEIIIPGGPGYAVTGQ